MVTCLSCTMSFCLIIIILIKRSPPFKKITLCDQQRKLSPLSRIMVIWIVGLLEWTRLSTLAISNLESNMAEATTKVKNGENGFKTLTKLGGDGGQWRNRQRTT